MGYPIYKLLRAVNRQYPNNGFIDYVDVREDMYDSFKDQLIDEDLRDLINETIQEVYKDIAIDEVYSFPTVPGQNQYVLPKDCDLRDIQEVTRTFRGIRGPMCPPPPPPPIPTVNTLYFFANGGEGEMEPIETEIGGEITLPECEFDPPDGYKFKEWEVNGNTYNPGDKVEMQGDFVATAVWEQAVFHIVIENVTNDDKFIVVKYKPEGEAEQEATLYYKETLTLNTDDEGMPRFDYVQVYFEGELLAELGFTEALTKDEYIPIVHPIQEPSPEIPIGPAVPVQEVDPEEPINPAEPIQEPDPEEPIP